MIQKYVTQGDHFLMEFENIFLHQIIYVPPIFGVTEKSFFYIFLNIPQHFYL